MPPPDPIRAVAFVDGQNLFHSAKSAFGHNYPSYDPLALARSVCAAQGWHCQQVRFYTGVPDAADNAFWNHFWIAKCAQMGPKGFNVALLFCSDQDLSEVAEEIRLIARERRRWIKIASAYPYSPAYKVRGIDKTDWIPIDRATYDACLDPRDYRPKRPPGPASG